MSDELLGYRWKTFVTDGRPDCVVAARDCAVDYQKHFDTRRKSRQNSIALLGIAGTGKTRLLATIANHLMSTGVSVLYFPHVEGFRDLKDNFDDLGEKIRVMQTVDLLWWDDLYKGREVPTPFQLDVLFDVINYRYLNNLPIMISSERDIDAICEVDMGIGSRIYEMTRDNIVHLLPDEDAGIKDLNYRLKGA